MLRRVLAVGAAVLCCTGSDHVAPAPDSDLDATDQSQHHGLSDCTPIQVVTMETVGNYDLDTTAVLLRDFDPVVDPASWTLEALGGRFGDEEIEASR